MTDRSPTAPRQRRSRRRHDRRPAHLALSLHTGGVSRPRCDSQGSAHSLWRVGRGPGRRGGVVGGRCRRGRDGRWAQSGGDLERRRRRHRHDRRGGRIVARQTHAARKRGEAMTGENTMPSVLASLRTYAVPALYIASAIFFILGLKAMCKVRVAGRGTTFLATGFILALAGLAIEAAGLDPTLALVGGMRGPALGLAAFAGLLALVLAVLAAVGPAARASGQSAAVALSASASGLATAALGFAFGNPIVATVGGLVAAAAWTLAGLVAQALGRKPSEIVLGLGRKAAKAGAEYDNLQACGAEEAAMVLENASKVVIVPGYGMAVAQAQHALHEVAKMLEQRGAKVLYAIHPAAGLIPGHMNILLDEAKVPAAQLVDWQTANTELASADVALVVGANDIVNPAAQNDPKSAVFGMPLIDVAKARTVFVIKRS